MSGEIESGQLYTVVPVNSDDLKVGDIVLCKVSGYHYIHLMKVLIYIPLLFVGCTPPTESDAPAPIAPTAAQPARSVDSFRFIDSQTTMQQVISRLGAPDRNIGSGLYVYAYRLSDGTDVLIGSSDGSNILYVRHGTEELYFQKK